MVLDRMSLLWRIRWLTAIVVAAVSLLGLAMVIYERIDSSEKEFSDNANSIVLALMPMLQNTLVVGDLATVQQTFDGIVQQESVRRIALLSPRSGRMVVEAVDPTSMAGASGPPAWMVTMTGVRPLIKVATINVGGTDYGTLQLEMSQEKLINGLWHSTKRFLAIGVICLAGIVLVMDLALRRGLEPLRLVTDRACRLAAGDWSERIPPVSVPEIAVVAETFNQMGDNIARREADLVRAKEAAEAANRAKATFLGTMSHEIRTPLNGIMGMTDLLLSSQPTDEQRSYLQLVKSSADTLLSILSDILDYSNIDSGRVSLAARAVDLAAIASEVVDQFAFRCRNKNLATKTTLSPDPLPLLVGDAVRLTQVLTNLYGNAVKFTQYGEISLSIAVEPRGPTRSHVQIDVADTGIGIAPENLDSIFDPFSQADGSLTRRFGGTGLGLAISRRTVEMMGGRLSVDSAAGRGSTFHVSLELTNLPHIDANPAPSPAAEVDNAGA
jgi:signal transduction histidine kinase